MRVIYQNLGQNSNDVVQLTAATYRQKLRVKSDPSVCLRVFSFDVIAKDCGPAVIRRTIPSHENKVVVAVDNFRFTWNAWSICRSQHTRVTPAIHHYPELAQS